MLLPDFVQQNEFTVSLLEFIVNQRTGNRTKKEHIEEDKHDEKYIIGLVILYRYELVVRIRIVGSSHVDNEYHRSKSTIVSFIRIDRKSVKRIGISEINIEGERTIANESKTTDNNREED